jgi:ATP-dependent DNA helicase RecQ
LYNENSIFESELQLKKSIISPEFCRSVYGKLNDYFQIAKGELNEGVFDFDPQEFALRYDFPFIQVYYALNHLHHEDIIFYDQNPAKTSRVRVIENNSKLFKVQSLQNIQAQVLQMLLRTYGGIHDQFIAINESLISSKLKQPKEAIIRALKRLDQDKVIVYKKSVNKLKLNFLVPREDNFIYHTIRANITQRNKTKITKSLALHDFIKNDQTCRQIQLLNYFGEKLVQPCGHCDVCRSRENADKIDYKELSDQILSLIKKHKTLSINEMGQFLQIDKEAIVKTLQLLVERKFIDLNLQNKFYLIT